jgi:phosphatidylserine/phosphatidylglycerophosphate/cardiolipin synthase-like enzyme
MAVNRKNWRKVYLKLSVILVIGMLWGTTLLGCSSTNSERHVATKVTSTLVTLPDAGYQTIYDFIASANQSIDMTMYALIDPNAEAALIDAAQRGINVRILLNSNASDGGTVGMNQPAYENLTANGVSVVYSWDGVLWHQKSIVVDNQKVAIMNCNLVAQYYPILRDYVIITDNPATVTGVATTFEADYSNNTIAPVTGDVPEGSELVWSPGAEEPLTELIATAKTGTTLYVETEQLDSAALENALIDAVNRGVTVNFTMTNTGEFTQGFDTLKAGGVNVHLYPSNASIYIQSKAISVNNDTVYIGSTNFTDTSANADRNVGIITKNEAIVTDLTATLAKDFEGAPAY